MQFVFYIRWIESELQGDVKNILEQNCFIEFYYLYF
jgi:hypothetical protein